MSVDVRQVAAELIAAKRERATVPSLAARHAGFSTVDGYAIANAIARRRIDAGDKVAGRKVGLTNPRQWPEKQANGPIWGYVHDTTLLLAKNGKASVDLGEARAARLEPEIAFRLSRPIDPTDTRHEAMLECIEWAAPCFELIDCHFEGWKFNAAEGIADSGVHYRLVVGEPLLAATMPAAELAAALGTCQVTLSLDGAVAERGAGSNTLGHPLNALAALVKILSSDPESQPLGAGEVITTGTLTPPRDIAPGQAWEMQVSGVPFAPLMLVLPR
jgi:2-oxo-3-hexenedioate decarboxylase